MVRDWRVILIQVYDQRWLTLLTFRTTGNMQPDVIRKQGEPFEPPLGDVDVSRYEGMKNTLFAAWFDVRGELVFVSRRYHSANVTAFSACKRDWNNSGKRTLHVLSLE